MKLSRHSKNNFCAGLGLLALVAACCYSEPLMNFDKLTYTVAEMMGPPQSLTIGSDGSVLYESHSNAATPDTPEIGIYETTLTPAEMDALRASLENPPLKSLSDHYGKIVSGDRVKRVIVSMAGDTIAKMIGTTKPVQPELAAIISRLDRIVAEVMQHPVRTLRMDLSHVVIDNAGLVTLDFSLSGGGVAPTEFVNPLADAPGAGLSIRGWPDKPAAQFRAGEVFGVKINGITSVDGSSQAAASHIAERIRPGERLSFHATAAISVPTPGRYVIQLQYQNPAEQPDAPGTLVGELFSKPTKVDVPALK